MKSRFLMLALMVSMLAGAAYAEDSAQPPVDPAANASMNSTQDAKCGDGQPAATAEGDPQAPQNQVEYGGA